MKGTSKTWLTSAREGIKVDGHFPYVGFRGVLQVEGGRRRRLRRPRRRPGGQGAPPALKANPGGIVPF